MQYDRYEYTRGAESRRFWFDSVGPKGHIRKMVVYRLVSKPNIYNLGFGDYDENTDSIDDYCITNNGDSIKVLATVARTVYEFTDAYPNAIIIATGSTDARNRLYRMGLANNLVEISKDFLVKGFTHEHEWHDFVIGEDYEAFLVVRKHKWYEKYF